MPLERPEESREEHAALARELAALRPAPPEGLTDAVMQRVSRERRFLGFGAREWVFMGASFSLWALALFGVVQWVVARAAL